MVLTKAYLRYTSVARFGIVCSARGNCVFVKRKGTKSDTTLLPFVAVPALEDVIVWDIRTGDQVTLLKFTNITVETSSTTRETYFEV